MTRFPFDCLLMPSSDEDLDDVVLDALADAGHAVERVPAATLVASLRARTRPAVVVKNVHSVSGNWQFIVPALAQPSEVTRRHGYVMLNLFPELTPQPLVLPEGHDITILSWLDGMQQVAPTIEQVGTRVAARWTRLPPH